MEPTLRCALTTLFSNFTPSRKSECNTYTYAVLRYIDGGHTWILYTKKCTTYKYFPVK